MSDFYDRYSAELAEMANAALAESTRWFTAAPSPRLHEIYREMFDIQETYRDEESEDAKSALVARYDSLRDELIAILGEDVGVGLIDPWFFDLFSDCYKSDVGFRPRNHTYRQAIAYMADRAKEIA
jgi:hypothetical protein